MTISKSIHMRFATIMFALMLAGFSIFPAEVLAADTVFYKTWEEAQPVFFPDSTGTNMNEVAYAIEQLLVAGRDYLEAGDLDTAYVCAQQSYYGYYEKAY